MPTKEQILAVAHGVPVTSLITSIQRGIISLDELRRIQLAPEKLEVIEQKLKDHEDQLWNKACQTGDAAHFFEYLKTYPGGTFAEPCRQALISGEEHLWKSILDSGSTSLLKQYLELYKPLGGAHIHECQEMLQHPEWMQVKKNEAVADHDTFVAHMKSDLKNADEIQKAVAGNIITWDEVVMAYGLDRTQAIKDFVERNIQPNPRIPETLTQDSTEVYFWGTPSSGKTCAIGSILCGAMNNYNLEPQRCQGMHYMTQLRNVFDAHLKYCSLPPSTIVNVIQEMVFTITDIKNRLHRATFIDIAGEIFRSIYYDMNEMFLDQEHKDTLAHVMKFLADNSNPKIHFFVVEYGGEATQWEGLYMRDYLQACSLYIKDNKILKNSTGVYVLVTKCDKMHCPDEMIVENAEQFVKNNLSSFYNNLQMACDDAGIKDFKIIPFSIGEVFAGKICCYDDSFIDDVIDVLIAKTPTIKKNNFLRL